MHTPSVVSQIERISGKSGVSNTRATVVSPCAVDHGSGNYQGLSGGSPMRNSYIGTTKWGHFEYQSSATYFTAYLNFIDLASCRRTSAHSSWPRCWLGDMVVASQTCNLGERLSYEIQACNVDIFGGCSLISTRSLLDARYQVSLLPIPKLVASESASLLRGLSIPSSPYDHSMLAITVTHAHSL